MSKYNRYRKFLHGFTLVELLVVISIIALLLAILMPSLGKARRQAQKIICKSNQRQLHLATVLYVVDNDDKLPPTVMWAGYVKSSGGPSFVTSYWPYRYSGYVKDMKDDIGGWDPYWKQSIFWCPANKKSLYHYPHYDFSCFSANDFLGGRFNNLFEPLNGLDPSINYRSDSTRPLATKDAIRYKLSKVKSPATVLAWVDSAHTWDDGHHEGRCWVDFGGLAKRLVKGGSKRHEDKNNYMFADGHSESRPPEDFEDLMVDRF